MPREPCNKSKWNNILIIGIPQGEETEKGIANLVREVIAKNFPNLVKETDIQVLVAQRAPNEVNPERFPPRYIVIRMASIKNKERSLKTAGERHIPIRKNFKRLSAKISGETLQSRGEWNEIFKVIKTYNQYFLHENQEKQQQQKPIAKNTLPIKITIQTEAD